jgi:zinc transport system ATP-binding protein
MNPIIQINDLSAGYDKIPVIRHVNLKIFSNDFIGVIGPNGGGKTTLLKVISGLLQPLSGSIEFDDELIDKKSIGYLPQIKNIDKKFPITVFDVVRSGLMLNRGKENSVIEKQKVTEILEESGIAGVSKKAIGELSGGQMQRVFLCRALISEPKILLLDEPDTFVDNTFEGELYEKLQLLNEKMAIILVSHDVSSISGHVKTIACMNGGLHYHPENQITQEQLDNYNCPIKLVSHAVRRKTSKNFGA